jgi:hypothetical protein
MSCIDCKSSSITGSEFSVFPERESIIQQLDQMRCEASECLSVHRHALAASAIKPSSYPLTLVENTSRVVRADVFRMIYSEAIASLRQGDTVNGMIHWILGKAITYDYSGTECVAAQISAIEAVRGVVELFED